MIPISFLDKLADRAADEILPHFRAPLSVENKKTSGFDPVTAADKAAEQAMRALIESHYPDHGILGEEFENKTLDADRVWILDPIDGTRSFISGVPVWGTLIGHKHQGRAELGMMAQHFTQERFAGDGNRAWYKRLNGSEAPETQLQTRPCTKLENATLFTTSPSLFDNDKIGRYQQVEEQVQLARYGIDCYAYCMVASGHADLVIEAGLAPYDIAALIPIIEGAGGVITTWQGDNAVDGGAIVASGDPALHELALKLLNN